MNKASSDYGYFRSAVIVIPVTSQNYQYVDATFQSILDTSRYGHDICLITYSLDTDNFEQLDKQVRAESPRVRLYTHLSTVDNPLLFAVEILFDKYSDCDFIIVHPGVRFPKEWDKKLTTVAYSDPHVGAVSPMCDDSRLFGIPMDGLDRSSSDFINSCLQHFFDSAAYQIPYFTPNCVYLRRDALQAIAHRLRVFAYPSDQIDIEIAQFLKLEGYYSVITSNLYIEDLNSESLALLKYLESQDAARSINRALPLAGTRYLLNKCKDYAQSPFHHDLPVQLHVMHSWGGGLERWVGDFCDTDSLRKNLVLKSIGN